MGRKLALERQAKSKSNHTEDSLLRSRKAYTIQTTLFALISFIMVEAWSVPSKAVKCAVSFESSTRGLAQPIHPLLAYALYFDFLKVQEISFTASDSEFKTILENPYSEKTLPPVLELFSHERLGTMGQSVDDWLRYLLAINRTVLSAGPQKQLIRNYGVSADLSVDYFNYPEVHAAGRHRYLNSSYVMSDEERATGEIFYVDVWNIKPEVARILSATMPRYKHSSLRDILKALLKWELNQLKACTLRAPSERTFTSCVSRFIRDCVALHPFADGNGRTVRTFAQSLLIANGYRPFIVLDPNKDYLSTAGDWLDFVRDGQSQFSHLQNQLYSEQSRANTGPGVNYFQFHVSLISDQSNNLIKLLEKLSLEKQTQFRLCFGKKLDRELYLDSRSTINELRERAKVCLNSIEQKESQ